MKSVKLVQLVLSVQLVTLVKFVQFVQLVKSVSLSVSLFASLFVCSSAHSLVSLLV